MFKRIKGKLFAIILILALVIGAAQAPVMASLIIPEGENYENQVDNNSDRRRGEESFDQEPLFLSQILERTPGIHGFDYFSDVEMDGMVEIAVQFATPSAVELRLLHYERPNARRLADRVFEEQALEAHTTFRRQLQPLMRARMGEIEIFSEHSSLFNGVFMRVPKHMVDQILALDEVYLITPNRQVSIILPGSPEGPQPPEYPEWPEYPDWPEYPEWPEWPEWPDDGTELESEDFMRESLELFNMDYIHNDMGITGEGIRVAVLDTGVDYTHPRLVEYADPATGRVRGWNYIYDTYQVMDYHGHGTHVSGTVIAMAPNVELWHFQVLDEWGFGSFESVISGIESAHRERMDVMNLSLGGYYESPFCPMAFATTLAMLDGVIVVNAAGNNGPWEDFTMDTPGIASLPIAVGSGTLGGRYADHDEISWFSSVGPVSSIYHIKPDIMAPGENIVSLALREGYHMDSGTSMAAPHIAGLAALMIERFPDATTYEIKARMMNTARPLADVWNPNVFHTGAGFVVPMNALEMETFATVRHQVPWIIDGRHSWKEVTMSSMSFGIVVAENSSAPMTVTIHNPGDGVWNHTINFNGNYQGVSLELMNYDTSGAYYTYTFRVRFAEYTEAGLYNGMVEFYNEDQRITMPFGVMYDCTRRPHIDINPDEVHSFGRALVGYESVSSLIASVTNRGNVPTGTIGIELAGANPEAFITYMEYLPSLEISERAIFAVEPRLGLEPGEYVATLILTILDDGISWPIELRFTVDSEPAYEIELWSRQVDFDDNWEMFFRSLWQTGEWSFGSRGNYGFWCWQGGETIEMRDIWIKNTGNVPTGELTVTIQGEGYRSFGLAKLEETEWGLGWVDIEGNQAIIPSINPGEYDVFGIYILGAPGTHMATVAVTGNNMQTQYFEVRDVMANRAGTIRLEAHVDEVLDLGVIPYGFFVNRSVRVQATNTGNVPIRNWETSIRVLGELERYISIWHRGFYGLPDPMLPGEEGFFLELFVEDLSHLPVGVYTSTVVIYTPYEDWAYGSAPLWDEEEEEEEDDNGIQGPIGTRIESFNIRITIEDFSHNDITLDYGQNIDFGIATRGYYFDSWWDFCEFVHMVWVLNTGRQDVWEDDLVVRIEGRDAGSFRLLNFMYWVDNLQEIGIDNFYMNYLGWFPFGVRPVEDLEPGIYEATVTVSGRGGFAEAIDIRFEVEEWDFQVALSPSANHDFGTIQVGDWATPHWVYMTSGGNTSTGRIEVTITGENPESFRLSRTSASNLHLETRPYFRDQPDRSSAFFVVTPKDGLEAGTHTATIAVTGENVEAQSFDVTIVVEGDGDVCDECGEYPCVCPPVVCDECGEYPCVCPPVVCDECGEYPCVCPPVVCDECGEYPCVCPPTICDECGQYPCVCPPVICDECGEWPCVCPPLCDDCDKYPCECPAAVDRAALRAAIRAAEARVGANYTRNSWTRFTAALEAARVVYRNPDATQAQIDAATVTLINAMNGLIRVTGDPVPDRDGVPKTGDEANVNLWIMLFGAGFLGFMATGGQLVRDWKKRRQGDR